jgi:hypothetical protein
MSAIDENFKANAVGGERTQPSGSSAIDSKGSLSTLVQDVVIHRVNFCRNVESK